MPELLRAGKGELSWRWLFRGVLALFLIWQALFLLRGPTLPIVHDELNLLYESLRLPAEFRLSGYVHGPLLYELIACVEVGWFAILRIAGAVSSPEEFLVHVLTHPHAHLVLGRALVGGLACATLFQVYRLGGLFGGIRVGALAGLLWASNLTFFAFACVLKEDLLFLFLFVSALLQGWGAVERRQGRGCFVTGLLIGASTAAKYFGVFALALLALPFLCLDRKERSRAAGLSFWMALGFVVAIGVFIPFLITDTNSFFGSIESLVVGKTTAGTPTLPRYLWVHLPNLVGWVVLMAGSIEWGYRLIRQPRGPIMLGMAPLFQMLWLGSRSGYSVAYYIFPMALFLSVLAAAFFARVLALTQLGLFRFLILPLVISVVVLDGAFLRGSSKHALLLLAPDSRIFARDWVHTHVPSGERILLTHGIVGMNFWGPPLVPIDPGPVVGPFTAANQQILQQWQGPRYHLKVIDGFRGFSPALIQDCDWLITTQIGTETSFELSKESAQNPPSPPPGFELAALFVGFPPQRSTLWPFFLSSDYAGLSEVSLKSMWGNCVRGLTIAIYHRNSK